MSARDVPDFRDETGRGRPVGSCLAPTWRRERSGLVFVFLAKRWVRFLLCYVPIQVLVARYVWRDLSRRPSRQVRGSKLFWRWASGANTLGAVAYLVVGRKRASTTST